LRRNIPTDALDNDDADEYLSATWVGWRYAQRAEAIARLFWPGLAVKAAANPRYEGCDELAPAGDEAARARRALAEARRAIVSAETLVRCGATLPPPRPVRLAERATQLMGVRS
jgi:hypothetical protein